MLLGQKEDNRKRYAEAIDGSDNWQPALGQPVPLGEEVLNVRVHEHIRRVTRHLLDVRTSY